MYSFWLATINIFAVILVIILKWYLSKGILKPVYWLGIATACLFTCVNIMLFVHDSSQWSIMLLNIMNFYSVIMNIVGLRRLYKKEKHRLIDGRVIDLTKLIKREQAFLCDLQKMARQNINYFEIVRVAVGPGSVALKGENRASRQLVESPLYLVARDIATRVGIKQGLIPASKCKIQKVKFSVD